MLQNMLLKEEVLNQTKRRINHGKATIKNQKFNSTLIRRKEEKIKKKKKKWY